MLLSCIIYKGETEDSIICLRVEKAEFVSGSVGLWSPEADHGCNLTLALLLVSQAGTAGWGSRQPFSSALAPTHPSFLPSYRLQLLLAISSFAFLEHASILMLFPSKAGNEAAGESPCSLLSPSGSRSPSTPPLQEKPVRDQKVSERLQGFDSHWSIKWKSWLFLIIVF